MRNMNQILKGTRYDETKLEYFFTECVLDFIFFAKHVLGFNVSKYHEEWFQFAEKYPRLCIMAYRGSGKTNWFAGYFIWKAIFSEGLNFLIMSNTEKQSIIVLRIIRDLIEENELLNQFVPLGKESTWKATELTLKTKATFYSKTYGQNVKGLRIDYVLCDEGGQYEDKSAFWTAVSPVVQLNRGRIVVIGTPESPADLLHELKDNEVYYFGDYPVMVDGKPLWPEKYTMENFDHNDRRSIPQIKRELGALAFQQEYMLIPVSSANSLFPKELLKAALSKNEKFLPFGRKNKKYYIGYDMARSPKGDYTVMTVLEVNNDKKTIVHAIRVREDFDEQVRILNHLIHDFKPEKIVIDGTGMGDKQALDIEREISGVEILKITYDLKYKMFMDLRREFEKFNIVIPASNKDPETWDFKEQLFQELSQVQLMVDLRVGQTTRNKFKFGKYDDCVNSLAYANKAAEEGFALITFRGVDED